MNDQAAVTNKHQLNIPALEARARMRRIVIGVGFAVLVAAVVVYYTRPKPVVELYRTDRVERRTLVQLVEATGSLDVRSRVEVPAPIAGRLIAIHVQAGQRVELGAELATLDERAAELAVKSAQASVEAANGRVSQARAALDEANRNQQQVERLKERGLASDSDVEAARSSQARSAAALDAARADYKLATQSTAQAQLGKSLGNIVAPSGGIVLRAPENVGAAVSPERGPLFVIGEPLDVMRIDAPVSETDIALLHVGQKAEVLVQALPGRTFDAQVKNIGIEPTRDGGVVLYPVTLLVQNPDRALLPGMSARVRLEVARAENVLSAHEAALRFTPEGYDVGTPRGRVWVRRGPTEVTALDVTTGVSDGVYTALVPVAGQTLAEGTDLAIGLLRPESGAARPSVTLGAKK